MATSVNSAFNQFLTDTVNVPSSQSDTAKSSRDFLIGQINSASSNGNFLRRYGASDTFFGSFARKTKIKPLDDIDIIIGLSGGDLTMSGTQWNNIELTLKEDSTDTMLKGACDKFSQYWAADIYRLNSTKVKNKLVSALQNISQYEKAEIHARGEAITVKLKSYIWTFDVVPAFYCEATQYEKAFYLIPNGYGNWKKTNPKIEQERVSRLNQKFGNSLVLNTIRLVKYWNRRGQMPNIASYVLETILLDYFDSIREMTDGERYPDIQFKNALNYISTYIIGSVQDTKGFQGDINSLTWEQKCKIQTRANSDHTKAKSAITAEITEKDDKKSINIWRDIFGGEFPQYG